MQVVFLGEYHDDAIAHSLELELLQQAHARYASQAAEEALAADGAPDSQGQGKVQQTRRSISLSLEMLERDVQGVVDEYLAGHVRERDLAHVSACTWPAVLLCADLGTCYCSQRPTNLLQYCLAQAPPACLVVCISKGGHGHEPNSVRPQDGRLWPNYRHDYRPLVETAKAHNMPVVCANPPRRYVSLAGRSGREALEMLPVPARQWLPPLPWALPSEAYVHKTNSLAQMARDAVQEDEAAAKGEDGTSLQQGAPQIGKGAAEAPRAGSERSQPGTGAAADTAEEPGNNKSGEGNLPTCPWIGLQRDSNFLAAQTLWDAGMAWSIAEHLTAQRKLGRDPLVCHVSGKFHCEHLLGIPEHLQQYAPDAKPLVVIFMPAYGTLTLTPEQFAHEQLAHYAHFVVLTDGEHPRSFSVQHPV